MKSIVTLEGSELKLYSLTVQRAQLNIERRTTEDYIERIRSKIANTKQADFSKCVNEGHQEKNSQDENTSQPHTPMMMSQQVEHSFFEQSSKQESIVLNMEVESCEDQNVPIQQKEAVPMERYSPEQLSDTLYQQRRHYTDDQTSSAHEQSCTDPHLQSLGDKLANRECCNISIPHIQNTTIYIMATGLSGVQFGL